MIDHHKALVIALALHTTCSVALAKRVDPYYHQQFADTLTPLLYTNPNECSSALGVSMAFSLIYPGCTNDAVDQVRDTFGYPGGNSKTKLVWEDTLEGLVEGAAGQCVREWDGVCQSEAPLLKIANSVWFDNGDNLTDVYEDVVGEYAKQIDFSAANSPFLVNEWVKNSTNGMIDSIVDTSQPLYPPYALLAINSIYLKARWSSQFYEERTNLDSFYKDAARSSEEVVSQAHFMNAVGHYDYSHDAIPGYQVIKLPFAESTMSMLFVLPMSNVNAAKEFSVSSRDLIEAYYELESTRMALSLPKYKFESEYEDSLQSALVALGISDPFTKGTESLCGIFDNEEYCPRLVINKVIQKTVIDVNEKGVEATAVTAIAAGVTSVGPPPEDPTLMMLNHPFQFFIYDSEEELVLFEGRVGQPEVPEGRPAVPLLDAKHGDAAFWSKSFGVTPLDAPDTTLTMVPTFTPTERNLVQCETGSDANPKNECERKGEFCQLTMGVCNAKLSAYEGVCELTPQMCSSDYKPVCGCDGKDYSNACEAHSAGVSVSREGECSDATGTDIIDTQCETGLAADPANGCQLNGAFCQLTMGVCNAKLSVYEGVCELTPQMCTFDYKPVCGCDGKDYSNACEAHSAGVSVSREGECSEATEETATGVSEETGEVVTEPTVLAAESDSVDSTDQQKFADDLTSILYSKENECSSALGVSMAFSLIYPGCMGDAIEQVRTTLGYPNSTNMQLVWESTTQKLLKGADGACVNEWDGVCSSNAPLLKIANSVWVHDEYTLNPEYEVVLGDEYVQKIDFKADNSPVLVNEWVEESTNGLIDSIVLEDAPLFPPTILLAINSIYLKARWLEQFQVRMTNRDSFYESSARATEVSKAHFMNMVEHFDYSHNAIPGYQVIDLPFVQSTMSMIFVLPMKSEAAAVSSWDLIAAVSKLEYTRMALSLPKFKFESTYKDDLKKSLRTLGIEALFTEGTGALCDMFEDQDGCDKLVIDEVIQKTVIDVNEKGVEAAAVTAIGVSMTSVGPPPEDPTLMVMDHPFQFFIYDKSQDLMLFEGRLGKPDLPTIEPDGVLLDMVHSSDNFWENAFFVNPIKAADEEVTSTSSSAASINEVDILPIMQTPSPTTEPSSSTTEPTSAAVSSTGEPTGSSSPTIASNSSPTPSVSIPSVPDVGAAYGPGSSNGAPAAPSSTAKKSSPVLTGGFLAFALACIW